MNQAFRYYYRCPLKEIHFLHNAFQSSSSSYRVNKSQYLIFGAVKTFNNPGFGKCFNHTG